MANGNGAIKEIEKLVSQLRDAQLKIKELENEVANLKTAKNELETETIPDIMFEQGLNAVTLSNGIQCIVKPFYHARVLKDKPEPFYDWLKKHGHGALVKSHYEVWTSDDEMRELLTLFSQKFHVPYEMGEQIHWKTLEAWFREQTEKGLALPIDLFENFVGRKATLK